MCLNYPFSTTWLGQMITILKLKKAIKTADVVKGVKAVTKQRSQIMEVMEKLLLLWINEKQMKQSRHFTCAILSKTK